MRYLFVVLTLISTYGLARAQELGPYLEGGRIEAAETLLQRRVDADADNAGARFGLGVVQFIGAFEQAAQSFNAYGFRVDERGVAFLPFGIPAEPSGAPQSIRYEDVRTILETFLDDLGEASETLAEVEDEKVSLELRVGLIRLDFDGDGIATEEESLWRLFANLSGARGTQMPEDLRAFKIRFDAGDVHWFRGYAELLSALTDIYLAHDSRELFERTAHLTYERVETPHDFLSEGADESLSGFDAAFIADLIAFIHLMNFEVSEPERLRSALRRLSTVTQESRLTWQAVLAETDNELEWLPNPDQQSVIGVQLTQAQIEGWLGFLDELDQIVAGDLLVPYWRVQDGRGVNMRRVFLEPRTLDLLLWIQGSAATPYLEEGELSSPETWGQLQRLFDGNFLNFAVWIN